MSRTVRQTSLWCASALLPDGWAQSVRITLHGGMVASVESGVSVRADDEPLACVIPGLSNLHSHAFQRAMAGLSEIRGPEGDDFWTWREVMYHFAGRMTPDDLQAVAAMAFVEMLEAGFTRVGEFHYLHHDTSGQPYAKPAAMSVALVDAAEDTGIALTLLPVLYAHSGFGGLPPTIGQRRFLNDVEGYLRLHESASTAIKRLPDGVIGVAPHSLRAVTPDELQLLLSSAAAAIGPVHIHVAEQLREVDECLAWSGQRPVDWLLGNCAVDARWCLVHATHMTEAETTALARSGAIAGLCPITEANLGDGVFPAQAFLAAGGRYGIGSDSNVLIDASEELRLLEYGQRLGSRQRNRMVTHAGASTGSDLFHAAGEGGAAALGASWGIAAGRTADFIALDTAHPAMIARRPESMLDGFVFAAGRGVIDSVWRRGQKVVEAGRHRKRERIADAFRRTLTALTA